MNITTKFSCGDKAWVFGDNRAEQFTIGQIRIEVTESPGLEGHDTFTNYGPQFGCVEQYMCVESGIGSGVVYTLGKNIFETEGECVAANAEVIAMLEAEKAARAQAQRKEILSKESYFRAQLARIESMKAGEA